MDYFDILLAKKLSGGGGGDIEVETLNATENGTYNAGTGKAYNPVVVAVPEPTLIAKSISQNGTYNASDDNADGYSSVTVDVEGYQIKSIANVPTDIASFSDGTDLPMPKLEVGIEAVQSGSGDPSPSNVRPISGWTGANINVYGSNNIWDEQWEVGGYDTTTGQKNTAANRIRNKNYIKVLPNHTYYMVNANQSFRVFYYDENKTYLSNYSYNKTDHILTVDSRGHYINFQMSGDYGTTYNDDISINYPDTVTTYNAWNDNNQTYPITFGQTVYGGKLDVTNGTGTSNFVKELMSNYRWAYQSGSGGYFRSGDVPKKAGNSNVMSEIFLTSEAEGISPMEDNSIKGRDSDTYVFIRCNEAQGDITAFNNIIAGKYMCYEVDNPTAITTQPTQVKSLLGNNNIWADSGQIISGQYFAEL